MSRYYADRYVKVKPALALVWDHEDHEDTKANERLGFSWPSWLQRWILQVSDHRAHGGRPTVHVVPGSVTGEVVVVVPASDVEPLPPDGLTAVAALVSPAGALVDTPDPVAPSDVAMLAEPAGGIIGELAEPGDDVPLFGVDVVELIDDERGNVGGVCVNSSEMPLLPRTDPV
jgi:hypothetical protein